MNKLHFLRFRATDAWLSRDRGYDSIIETNEDGRILLRCLVDGVPYSIPIDEESFIESIVKFPWEDWNDKHYDLNGEDGWVWSIDISWDDKVYRTGGHGVFPDRMEEFVAVLHDMGMKKSNGAFFAKRDRLSLAQKQKMSLCVGTFNNPAWPVYYL